MAQSNSFSEKLSWFSSLLPFEKDEEFNYLRKLQTAIETINDEQQSETRADEPFVFWFVNGIWIMLVLTITVWLWKFNGVDSISQWMTTDSDEVYHRRLRERREAKKNEIPPEVRRQILHKHFRDSKVHMIVSKSDFLSESIPVSENVPFSENVMKNEHCLTLNSCSDCSDGSCSIQEVANWSREEDHENSAAFIVNGEKGASVSCDLADGTHNTKDPFSNITDVEAQNHIRIPEADIVVDEEENPFSRDIEDITSDTETDIDPIKNASTSSTVVNDDEHHVGFIKQGSSSSRVVEDGILDSRDGKISQFDCEIDRRDAENSTEAELGTDGDFNSGNENATIETQGMDTSSSEPDVVEESYVVGLCTQETPSDAQFDEEDAMTESGLLVVPAPNGDRRVPNCCAVCLGPYEVGDDVVWSENVNCLHAFHEECVTEWLLKMQDGNPCPCCRSVFVDMEHIKPVKKTKFSNWLSRFRRNEHSEE
mmetsp:Transcript_10395/g.15963  ORF Transcript_10395/g.15963 Transcript_10395/m.15963 type:complete len:482 (+) Transcript_10395:75-1520(+)